MPISRRSLLSAAAAVRLSARPGSRPKIILILSDDQRYCNLSIHGNTQLKTPHTDAIGWWEVGVRRAGSYDVMMTIEPTVAAGEASIGIGGRANTVPVEVCATACRFCGLRPSGPARANTMITGRNTRRGARYLKIRKGKDA